MVKKSPDWQPEELSEGKGTLTNLLLRRLLIDSQEQGLPEQQVNDILVVAKKVGVILQVVKETARIPKYRRTYASVAEGLGIKSHELKTALRELNINLKRVSEVEGDPDRLVIEASVAQQFVDDLSDQLPSNLPKAR
jgi:hypothetical protein